MQDINNFTIIGRLTRDAELKYTNSGMAVSSFAIAVNGRKKVGDQWEDEASFFDSSLFGKRAEGLNGYLTKGQQVALSGSLKQDRWEQEGQKRSKIKLLTNDIQLLGGKSEAGGNVQASQSNSQTSFDDTKIPF